MDCSWILVTADILKKTRKIIKTEATVDLTGEYLNQQKIKTQIM